MDQIIEEMLRAKLSKNDILSSGAISEIIQIIGPSAEKIFNEAISFMMKYMEDEAIKSAIEKAIKSMVESVKNVMTEFEEAQRVFEELAFQIKQKEEMVLMARDIFFPFKHQHYIYPRFKNRFKPSIQNISVNYYRRTARSTKRPCKYAGWRGSR